jgi:hypothetical protein
MMEHSKKRRPHRKLSLFNATDMLFFSSLRNFEQFPSNTKVSFLYVTSRLFFLLRSKQKIDELPLA